MSGSWVFCGPQSWKRQGCPLSWPVRLQRGWKLPEISNGFTKPELILGWGDGLQRQKVTGVLSSSMPASWGYSILVQGLWPLLGWLIPHQDGLELVSGGVVRPKCSVCLLGLNFCMGNMSHPTGSPHCPYLSIYCPSQQAQGPWSALVLTLHEEPGAGAG